MAVKWHCHLDDSMLVPQCGDPPFAREGRGVARGYSLVLVDSRTDGVRVVCHSYGQKH